MANHHSHGSGACPACDTGPFTRNAYWTGKLMLARDFTDEQRYVVDKLRRHNQTMHGSGTVCGLKVVPHDSPDCRARFLCVEPGTALDCCGHDIHLRDRDCFDLWSVPQIKKLFDDQDQTPRFLEICIAYRECGTEEVPILYDECGCDEDRSAPNRILESYTLHVHVLEAEPEPAPAFPEDCCTIWPRALDGCPHCDQADCVRLATISGWVPGNLLVDEAPDPVPEGGVAKIDNLTHRDLLPSVRAVKEFLDCLGICQPIDGSPDPGEDPDPEEPPVEVALRHICSINWPHGGALPQTDIENTLVVCFDGPVLAADLHQDSVRVFRALEQSSAGFGTVWVQVPGKYEPGKPDVECDAKSGFEPSGEALCTAVRFRAEDQLRGRLRIEVLGDLIRDGDGSEEPARAVDGNHLPPWLPSRISGDGIEGGTFQSFVEVT